jgi:hypothetical protein
VRFVFIINKIVDIFEFVLCSVLFVFIGEENHFVISDRL